MADALFIDLLGRKHVVIVPDFAECEDVVLAYGGTRERGGTPHLRALAAGIGLSTRIGKESKADYAAAKCDPLVYGGKVYGWLREQGATIKQINDAGESVFVALAEKVFPRPAEVEEAAGKSEASGAH